MNYGMFKVASPSAMKVNTDAVRTSILTQPPAYHATLGGVPTWAWILGVVGLAGLGWYFLGGGKKHVEKNPGRKRKSLAQRWDVIWPAYVRALKSGDQARIRRAKAKVDRFNRSLGL